MDVLIEKLQALEAKVRETLAELVQIRGERDALPSS